MSERSIPPLLSTFAGAEAVSVRFGRAEVELQHGSSSLRLSYNRYAAQARTDIGRRALLSSVLDRGDEAGGVDGSEGAADTLELPPSPRGASDPGDSASWESVPLILGSSWLLRPIGRGMFGEVYEAIDLQDGRAVAVKLLRMWDGDAVARFKREFRNLARVQHPHLIAPDEQGYRDGGWWWFSMELVEGVDFLDYVRRPAAEAVDLPVRLGRLLDATRQLVEAVDALHGHGVLHLDLKPRNVLIRPDHSVAVLDFGLSEPLQYHADGTRTAPAGFRGTPGYIAPEILQRRPPGTAADWYSVGAMLFGALSAQPPTADGPETRLGLLPDRVPEALRTLVAALLAPEPEDRPDAAGIRAALGLVPAPGSEHEDAPPPFVGREHALEVIERCLERVRAGRPVCMTVGGAPGIGKSTLVDVFLSRLAQRVPAPTVLKGRCYERQAIPYSGFDQVMEQLGAALASLDLFDAARILGPDVGELRWIFPALGAARAGEPAPEFGVALPVERRQRAFRAVKSVLRRAAERRPLVLALDDVQWGDVDTVELLVEIVSPPDPCPLLLILAVREPDGQGSAFLSRWEAATARSSALQSERLTLGPLAPEEAVTWVRQGLGPGADAGLVDELLENAGGVPYWLEALLAQARQGEGPIHPASVEEVVGARLAGLDDEARLLLDLVAFAGRPIEQEALLLAAQGDATKRGIHQLRRASLVREIGRSPDDLLVAWHDRVREAVVAQAEPSRAARMHGSLALALEQVGAPPEELAEHHHGAGDLRRAAEFAVVAAEEASGQLAFERAGGLLERALAWGTFEPERRRELARRHAENLFNSGHCTAAAEGFADASSDAEGPEAQELRRRAADAWLSAGQVERGLASLDPVFDALAVRRAGSPARAALGVLWQLGALLFRGPAPRAAGLDAPGDPQRMDLCWSVGKGLVPVMPMEGTAFMLQSLRLAQAAGDRHRSARVLAFVSVFLFQLPGLRRVGQRYLAHARAVGDEDHDAYLQAATELWTAATHVFSGNWRAMGDAARRAIDLFDARCVGVSWERVLASGFSVWALQFRGELVACGEEAEAELRDAGRRGDLYGQVLFRQYLSLVRLAGGDLGGARHHAERVEQDWMRSPYTVPRFYAMWLQATADLYEGDVERARQRVVDDLAEFRAAGGRRLPMWRIDMALLEARIGLAARERGIAPSPIRSLRSAARQLEGETRADGPAHARMVRSAIAAQDGDLARSRALLSEAIELYRAADMRLFEYSARLRRAELSGDAEAGAEAVGWMARRGVSDPERWARMYTPVALLPR